MGRRRNPYLGYSKLSNIYLIPQMKNTFAKGSFVSIAWDKIIKILSIRMDCVLFAKEIASVLGVPEMTWSSDLKVCSYCLAAMSIGWKIKAKWKKLSRVMHKMLFRSPGIMPGPKASPPKNLLEVHPHDSTKKWETSGISLRIWESCVTWLREDKNKNKNWLRLGVSCSAKR